MRQNKENNTKNQQNQELVPCKDKQDQQTLDSTKRKKVKTQFNIIRNDQGNFITGTKEIKSI